MKKSVIFFFYSPEHRQLPDVKELRISTLAEDGIAERSFYLRNSRLVTCTAPSSAVRGHGEGKGWENN